MNGTCKLLPYGISDYTQIKTENLYMVDKTSYLKRMEDAGHFLFLMRPRQFGKSLFLSLMEAYYDIEKKGRFEVLFGDTYVGTHPTGLQNQFQVLRLDFSKPGGTAEELENKVNGYLDVVYSNFVKKYAKYYPDDYESRYFRLTSTSDRINYVHEAFHQYDIRSYLLVDEYDHFINNMAGQHNKIASHSLSQVEKYYRDLFKKLEDNFNRILILGVRPAAMCDMASECDITTSLTHEKEFNEMLGFCENEVREMIRYYNGQGAFSIDEDETIRVMKPWYDGYCFSEFRNVDNHHVYNPVMVLYYLKSYLIDNEPPVEMVDPNTRIAPVKFDQILHLDETDGNRKGVLLEVADRGYTYGSVKRSFPAHQLTDPNMFKSLLFYYGMVTIKGIEEGLPILGIPNNNVREQYFNYLLVEYNKICPVKMSELSDAFRFAAYRGDWRGMMEYICRQYHDTTSVRSLIEGERNLQGFMNALLTLNPYYLVRPEVELNHGYCDFFLLPDTLRYPDIRHSYIIELKYLPVTATDEQAARQWEDAVRQIQGYGRGEVVRQLANGTELHLIVAQIKGYDLIRLEEVSLL